MILLTRVPDHKIAFLVRVTEDLGDIALIRQRHHRMVRRHILDGQNARCILQARIDLALPILILRRAQFGTHLQHQIRQHLKVRIQRLSMQCLGDMRRETHLRLFVRKARVRRTQLDVGHDPIIIPPSALDDDKRPLLNLLRRDSKPHAEILF